ncbi:MAG: hypothetical protein JXA60_12025 [Candidatus Coatesbacteria bacterium]|nr:hypothetical protein [Candidatus Coatesbacteria bacterium]
MSRFLILFILVFKAVLLDAGDIVKFDIKPCFNGYFEEGSYYPLIIDIETTNGDFEGRLEAVIHRTNDNDASFTWKTRVSMPGPQNSKSFEMLLPLPQWFNSLEVNLVSKDGKIIKQGEYTRYRKSGPAKPGIIPIKMNNLEYNSFLVLFISEQMTFPVIKLFSDNHNMQVIHPEKLPHSSIGLSSVKVIVIGDISPDNAKRYVFTRALSDWISQGGLLIVSPNPQWLLLKDQIPKSFPFQYEKGSEILWNSSISDSNAVKYEINENMDSPTTIEMPDTNDALNNHNIAEKDSSIVNQIDSTKVVLQKIELKLENYKIQSIISPFKEERYNNDLIWASYKYGLGSILVMAFNMQDTRNIPLLSRIPWDNSRKEKSYYDQNEKKKLLSNMENSFDYHGKIKIPTLLFISFFLFAYIIFIGPVNYFLFSYLKKRILLWYSVPASALLWTLAAYLIVFLHTEKDVYTTELNFVSAYVKQNNASIITLNSVFSPVRQNFTIRTVSDDIFFYPVSNNYKMNTIWEIDKGGREFSSIWFSPGETKSFLTYKSIDLKGNISCEHKIMRDSTIHFSITNNLPYDLDDAILIYGENYKIIGKFKSGKDVKAIIKIPMVKTSKPTAAYNPKTGKTSHKYASYSYPASGLIHSKIINDFKLLAEDKDDEKNHTDFIKAMIWASLDNGSISGKKFYKYFSSTMRGNPISRDDKRLYICGWNNKQPRTFMISKESKRLNIDFFMFEYNVTLK